jgi:hypothetical protein
MKNKKEIQRNLDRLKAKAVKDMYVWIEELGSDVTQAEIVAFKAGYIAGYNRGSNNA